MAQSDILKALRDGPLNNRELQEEVCDHSGGVARDCAKLIKRGKVRRCDAARGRGTRAIYELVE